MLEILQWNFRRYPIRQSQLGIQTLQFIPLSWWRAPTCQPTPSLSAKEHLRRPMTLEGKRLCKNRLYRCICSWPRLHITEPAHILQQSDAEWLKVIKSLSNWDEIKTTSYFLRVGEPMTIPTFYAFHKKAFIPPWWQMNYTCWNIENTRPLNEAHFVKLHSSLM